VSQDRVTLAEFLAVHGYHGPNEGELSSHSWREEPAHLQQVCQAYQRTSAGQHPDRIDSERTRTRIAAEAKLLGLLPGPQRPMARTLLRLNARFLPLREVGKASFVQAIDVGRATARHLGQQLVDTGQLAERDDVFYLTIDELRDGPPADPRTLIANRRLLRENYQRLDLPERWTGTPTAQPVQIQPAQTSAAVNVTGIPVSTGTATGRARVITDPDDPGPFEAGDILVCHTTDPSWVVLFHLAGAVVIDVGGPLSHGAIVARELGVPAVINTRTGTRLILDGTMITVNGGTGQVSTLP
jgi:pyruvate,water dikinase